MWCAIMSHTGLPLQRVVILLMKKLLISRRIVRREFLSVIYRLWSDFPLDFDRNQIKHNTRLGLFSHVSWRLK